jgi:hypothetical protein
MMMREMEQNLFWEHLKRDFLFLRREDVIYINRNINVKKKKRIKEMFVFLLEWRRRRRIGFC